VEAGPARPFDVREVVLDIRAARDRFGWSPKVGMEEGVARMWQWLEAQDRNGNPA
jgi:UDP-glucose 4-epimerase